MFSYLLLCPQFVPFSCCERFPRAAFRGTDCCGLCFILTVWTHGLLMDVTRVTVNGDKAFKLLPHHVYQKKLCGKLHPITWKDSQIQPALPDTE